MFQLWWWCCIFDFYIHGTIWLAASRTEEVYRSTAPSHDSSAKSRWEVTSVARVLQNDSLFMISMYCNSWHRYRKLSSSRELNLPACKKYKTVLHQSQLRCSFRRNIANNCYRCMFRIQLIFLYDTLSECKNTHTHNVQVSIRVVFRRTYTGLRTYLRTYRTHIYMRTYTHTCRNIYMPTCIMYVLHT